MTGVLQGARCSIDVGNGEPKYGTIVTDLILRADGALCYGVFISGRIKVIDHESIFGIDDINVN